MKATVDDTRVYLPGSRMTSYGVYRATSAAVLAFAISLTHFAVAQPAPTDSDRLRQACATLPESNESIILSARVEEAVRAGDFRLAVELIGKLRSLPSELIAAPASRTFHPVWRQAQRLLAQLPDTGLDVYRKLNDAEVKARFERAAKAGDLDELRKLFHAFPYTTDWSAVGLELASLLLDRGDAADAARVLTDLTNSPGAPSHAGLLLATALARVGATQAALARLREIKADPVLAARPGWEARLNDFEAWINAARASQSTDAAYAAPLNPRLEVGGLWAEPLIPAEADVGGDDETELLAGIETLRKLPLMEPVLADETLLVRGAGWIAALDAWTLAPRWRARENGQPDPDNVDPRFRHRAEGETAVSAATRDLLQNHLRHVVSSGKGMAFSVEPCTMTEFVQPFPQGRFQPIPELPTERNEIVARDLQTGAVRWRSGSDPSGPLFSVSFQDRPLVIRDQLVAPIRRDSDMHIVVLDPTNGKLIREVPVVGPPTHFDAHGGRCLLAADETTLFVSTGNGVIAALSARDFSWEWAATYPSTLVQHLGNRMWWQPMDAPQESAVDRPLLIEDLLVVAPIDSMDIFALDRFTGREVWRISRRENWILAGACEHGLIVGGQQVSCLDSVDPEGRPPRWRSVPLNLTGRPAIRGSRVFVPTRDGVAVLEARTGKLLAGARPTSDLFPASSSTTSQPVGSGSQRLTGIAPQKAFNLLAGQDAIYCVSTSGVSKLPDLERTRARFESGGAADSGDPRIAMVMAWIDMLAGEPARALDRLRDNAPSDPAMAAARDRLMTQLFLELARGAPAGEGQLAWLQRAAKLSSGGSATARLNMVIGAALEDAGRWDDACVHYLSTLADLEPRQAGHPLDTRLRVADWLYAATRLKVVFKHVSPSRIESLIDELTANAGADDDGAARLMRLQLTVDEGPIRTRIGLALAGMRLPAEVLAIALPTIPATEGSMEQRRTAVLARWEVNVSLADLPAAQATAAQWHALVGTTAGGTDSADDGTSEAGPDDAAARQVRQLEAAQRKLEQHRGTAFTADFPKFDRLWKSERTELIFDAREPAASMRPWLHTRTWDRERNELHLISGLKSGLAWRQTHDGLTHEDAVKAAALDARDAVEAFARMVGEGNEAPRSTWPMVAYGEFAVVPIRGGLICVGRGPLRSGGRRLWEIAIPQWSDVSRTFRATAAGTPNGLAFSPRPDRVQLVGWADGRVWWQRDFAGMTVDEVYSLGDWVVAVTSDGKVWAMDRVSGMSLARVAAERASPRFATVAAGRLVIGLKDAVLGLNPKTLELDWSRPLPNSSLCERVHGSDWILVGNQTRDEWRVVDASTGKMVVDPSIGAWKSIRAAAFDGQLLLIAAPARDENDATGAPILALTALDPQSGEKLWRSEFATKADFNATQLLAHADYVPVLIDRDRPGAAGPRRFPGGLRPPAAGADLEPAIRLIDKKTGDDAVSYPIRDKYEPAASYACGSFLLATRERLIVQIAGNLLAFGNDEAEASP